MNPILVRVAPNAGWLLRAAKKANASMEVPILVIFHSKMRTRRNKRKERRAMRIYQETVKDQARYAESQKEKEVPDHLRKPQPTIRRQSPDLAGGGRSD